MAPQSGGNRIGVATQSYRKPPHGRPVQLIEALRGRHFLSHNLYAVTRSHETPGDAANVDFQSANVGQESRCNQSDLHGMFTIP
jgi:hypothetical protein